MDNFLEFLSDNTFFAIFSGIIIVLVLAFIMTLVNGKKKDKKPIEDAKEDNYMNSLNSDTSIPNTGLEGVNNGVIFNQEIMPNSEEMGYQASFTNYVPDLNEESESVIPDIPSTESYIDVPYNEPIMPDAKEVMSFNGSDSVTPSVNEISNQAEEYAVPVPNMIEESPSLAIATNQEDSIIPDFSVQESKVEVEPINDTIENDEIEMPKSIMETPEVAFASLPTDDNSINEDIQIDTSEEYDYEKTEIFDFPDFSKTEIDSEKALRDVEKAVMEAANKYIDSIMKS